MVVPITKAERGYAIEPRLSGAGKDHGGHELQLYSQ